MPAPVERRRVLLAARPAETAEMQTLFAHDAMTAWEPFEADSLERARFLLQHNPFEILVIDESLFHQTGPAEFAWLTQRRETPTIFLTAMEHDTLTRAYEQGVSLCLPRRMTLNHPPMLAAALKRAAQIVELQRCHRRTKEGLLQCRRHVDRLVNLLWRTAPLNPQSHWFTHRHILERLQEEVSRSGRHGTVFTVALGEMQHIAEEKGESEPPDLNEWMTERVARAKRRCDIAGHYGLQGFLLLMVQTPRDGGVICCRRLQQYLHEVASPAEGPRGPIRACFGLSTFGQDAATSQSLLSRAEQHLELAKGGEGEGVVAG